MAKKKKTSDARKARRQRSWARRQEQKALNRAENEARAAQNRALRAEGKPTPWEAVKAARRAHRQAERRAAA